MLEKKLRHPIIRLPGIQDQIQPVIALHHIIRYHVVRTTSVAKDGILLNNIWNKGRNAEELFQVPINDITFFIDCVIGNQSDLF